MDARRRACLEAMGIRRWVLREDEAPALAVPGADSAPSPSPVAPESPAPPDPAGAGLIETMDWDELRAEVLACRRCGLAETRTQAVFGVGDPCADLLVIGEAPGADEDRLGEPFVGRAGRLLTAMLYAIGLAREQVYIANILKCRPPGNRDPRAEESLRCRSFLLRQIALVEPRLILAVGRVSAQNLLSTDAPVGRLRGRVHSLPDAGAPVVVTYHPAYLLRSPEQKARAWEDLQQVYRLLRGGKA